MKNDRSDEIVISQFLSGDIDSFYLLIDRYQVLVFSILSNLVMDESMIPAIVKRVFVNLSRRLRCGEKFPSLEVFIHRVSYDVALDSVFGKISHDSALGDGAYSVSGCNAALYPSLNSFIDIPVDSVSSELKIGNSSVVDFEPKAAESDNI